MGDAHLVALVGQPRPDRFGDGRLILNLVPLPPLDGGHLAVLVYEKVRRKKPDIRKLVPFTVVVAGFLVLFALAVAYIDVTNPLPSPFR